MLCMGPDLQLWLHRDWDIASDQAAERADVLAKAHLPAKPVLLGDEAEAAAI